MEAESNFGLIRYTLTLFFADQGLLEPNRRLAKTDRLLRCVNRYTGKTWIPSDGTKEECITAFFRTLGIRVKDPTTEPGLPTQEYLDKVTETCKSRRIHPESWVEKHRPLSSKLWKRIRYLAHQQHGYRCQCCGATSGVMDIALDVDHVKPRAKYPELALDLDNTQILCRACNIRKGTAETDYRRIQ